MTIIVNGNIIEKVAEGYLPSQKEDKVIDLKSMTVMPGWMDMHVHIESESGPRRYEETFRDNDAYVALKATQYCARTLDAGFTTVRDLGGTGVNVSLREAIKMDSSKAPGCIQQRSRLPPREVTATQPMAYETT